MTDIDRRRQRIRREVMERGLTSFMNDTKWRALQRVMLEELPFPPPYQRKDVLQAAPDPAVFDADVWYFGDWREGILPFWSIEWLRIRPRYLERRAQLLPSAIQDCREDLRAALAREHISFVERDDSFWVHGYARQLPTSAA